MTLKIIHLEDSITKAMDIAKEVHKNVDCTIDLVSNMSKGIELIEEANELGKPYDIAITDMHYPLSPGVKADWEAGDFFIDVVSERYPNLPVIVCSTHNMKNPKAYGCVWFNEINDWENEIVELIKKVSD